MYVDVVNVFGFHSRFFQRCPHYIECTQSFRVRGCDMVSIGSGACTGNFGINGGTTADGMFQLLEYNGSTSFSHHKSIPVFIKWP